VLGKVGWGARQLEGGYRAFRRHVVAELGTLPDSLELRVICGTTGSGKSLLLRQLERQRAQVLDLEQLAQHRGSVLGAMPAQPQPSQKMFETRLWSALRRFDCSRPVFVESESRKVGNLRVPDALLDRMRAAQCVRIELPLEERVRLLRREYWHFEQDRESLTRQLSCLVPLHGHEKVSTWLEYAAVSAWDQMVEALLREHYDPVYLRSIGRNFMRVADAEVLAVNSADESAYADAARQLLTSPALV
jgi:tRNA 2-selenouridine synthase